MPGDLPDYYFRIRDNGAVLFKVDTENRQRRIELDEIATINLKNGNVRPHGDHVLTAEERALIKDWIAARSAELARRDIDDIRRAVDHLNLTAHWAQSRATEEQLEEVTDDLLLAMHDLRTVLIRRKADRLAKGAKAAE
ncbi:hypothetical protein C0V75_15445 [Tabrizicola sp. TH137]|uniref:hypothetical protein n=1 Tax=Tabrizicola sp. TH137 TaxID=2067452 RepID=UPI000C7AFE49|nr:hypothetical protein [Tabrizicola sp. TH137]PLL11423.1 hypothetical protein C0V75_15445 [Tabrizicola sp. TH137]